MTCSLARFGHCSSALVTCADCGDRICQWHSALRPFLSAFGNVLLRPVCLPRCGGSS